MTSIVSVSRSDLTQRRRMLRSNRRIQLLQSLWRTLAISSIFGGLVWATTRPVWVLRTSEQIEIRGNYLLSEQVIQSLLPVSYPESLLQVKPEEIAQSLESHAPIAEVTVTRYLFPPSLTVQVKERVPVAIALTQLPSGNSTPTTKPTMGLLDQEGVWIPIQTYTPQVRRELELPQLKVIGLLEHYHSYWSQLYQAVSLSAIKVSEINCQDPANIKLKTELGTVHLGPYSPRLTEQLQVLAQMRQLTQKVPPSQLAYIDLKNLKTPTVQMNQNKNLVKPDTP